jgi:hypothetical protein
MPAHLRPIRHPKNDMVERGHDKRSIESILYLPLYFVVRTDINRVTTRSMQGPTDLLETPGYTTDSVIVTRANLRHVH